MKGALLLLVTLLFFLSVSAQDYKNTMKRYMASLQARRKRSKPKTLDSTAKHRVRYNECVKAAKCTNMMCRRRCYFGTVTTDTKADWLLSAKNKRAMYAIFYIIYWYKMVRTFFSSTQVIFSIEYVWSISKLINMLRYYRCSKQKKHEYDYLGSMIKNYFPNKWTVMSFLWCIALFMRP